jgi:hypothetical protein
MTSQREGGSERILSLNPSTYTEEEFASRRKGEELSWSGRRESIPKRQERRMTAKMSMIDEQCPWTTGEKWTLEIRMMECRVVCFFPQTQQQCLHEN